MGFSNYQNIQPEGKKKTSDLETVNGLVNYANSQGLDLEEPQPARGLLGGIQKFVDVLSTGEYVVGCILSGKGIKAGVEEKISPSDIILKNLNPDSGAGKFAKGALGLAIDVAFDPTTYLTLGTGSAIKVTAKSGAKVVLSKTGKEMLGELSKQVGEKAARSKVAEMALANKALQAKGGLKFAGKEFIPADVLAFPFKTIKATALNTKEGRALFEGVDNLGESLGKIFTRDYGLDAIDIKNKQKLYDGFNFARNEIADNIKLIFAGTTKVQREAISLAIERGSKGMASLEPTMRPLAREATKILRQLQKEEEARGLLNHWRKDYVTHLYRNKKRAETLFASMIKNTPNAYLRFAKQRRIPTITEAEKLGLLPEKDIANILAVRMFSSQKAMLTQDFLRDIAKTKGVKLNEKALSLNEDFVRLGDYVFGADKGIRDVAIPRYLGEHIKEMDTKLIDAKELDVLLKGYDTAINYFKGSVTVLFPSFHGRNFISNVAQNFLDIGINALNPARNKDAVGLITGKEGKIVTDIGTEYSFKQIRDMAKKMGVFTHKITRIDIEQKFIDNPIRGGAGKLNPVNYGRDFGRFIENEARLVNFVSNIRRGFDPEDAAQRTKDFLFDYENLSRTEKEIFRRFIPFYTWTRKNISLQVKSLVQTPGKSLVQLKTLQAIEDMFGEEKTEDEKKFAPDFILAGMNILLSRQGDDRTFLVGFDLPVESAFDFFNHPIKEAFSTLSPFIKAPIEGFTGHNFFKEKQIKDDDDGRSFASYPDFIKKWMEYSKKEVTPDKGKAFTIEKVNPQKKWWLTQIETFMGIGRLTSQSFLEPVGTMYKMLEGEEKITMQDKWNIVRFFTGLRAFTIDIEASKRAHEKNDVRELIDILERKGVVGNFCPIPFIPKEETEQKVPTTRASSNQSATDKWR